MQKRLDILKSEEVIEASKAEYLAVSKTLDDLLLKQEIFWAQRSRISWLKHRDKNTIFSRQSITKEVKKPHSENYKL